jgi:hypothetical protein
MKPDDRRAVELFESGLNVIIAIGGSLEDMKAPILNLFKKSLPSVAGMVLVEYIGSKNSYADCLYSTGTWNKGTPKRVSSDQAMKLFKHPDIYREYKEPIDIIKDVIEDVPEPEDTTNDPDKLSFDQKKEIFNNQMMAISDNLELREFSKAKLSGFEPDGRIKDLSKVRELIMAHVGVLGEGSLP